MNTYLQDEAVMAKRLGLKPLAKDGEPSIAALLRRKREVNNVEVHIVDPTLAMGYSRLIVKMLNDRVERLVDGLDVIEIQSV